MPTNQMRGRLQTAANLPIEREANARFARLKCQRQGVGKTYQLKRLPAPAQVLVHTMVHGLDKDQVREGQIIFKAHEPLTVVDACHALGFESAKMLQLARLDIFATEMMAQLNTRRVLEYARNLGVAMEIRDSLGDGTPRHDEVRLKAIMTIEGTFKVGGGPSVQINNVVQNNAEENLRPGYVIRLEPTTKTIDHESK